jgi:hypothetical protein
MVANPKEEQSFIFMLPLIDRDDPKLTKSSTDKEAAPMHFPCALSVAPSLAAALKENELPSDTMSRTLIEDPSTAFPKTETSDPKFVNALKEREDPM